MTPISYSAFSDEAASSLEGQIQALVNCQISGMDLRSIEGKNVLDLSQSELKQVREQCETAGLHIQCVGSPINKVDFSAQAKVEELEKLKRAISAAKTLGTSRIRLFTPAAPWEERSGVLDWMAELVQEAEHAELILLHENDAKFFGAYPDQEKWLFEQLGSPWFRAAFDFSNAVMIGFDPLTDFIPWILPYVDTFHIKDFNRAEGRVVACGEGDGNIGACLRTAHEAGFKGTFTLEPHLQSAGAMGGWSGEELFAYASQKMKEVVEGAYRSH